MTSSGFYQLATTHPGRTAVIGPSGEAITFGALGERVACVVHNGPECLEPALAACQVGLVLVPVNWRLAAEELCYILHDCAAVVVIADASQARLLPAGETAAAPVRGRRHRAGLDAVRPARRGRAT